MCVHVAPWAPCIVAHAVRAPVPRIPSRGGRCTLGPSLRIVIFHSLSRRGGMRSPNRGVPRW